MGDRTPCYAMLTCIVDFMSMCLGQSFCPKVYVTFLPQANCPFQHYQQQVIRDPT